MLDIAVNYRHGPPLHYLLVHASLVWREDVFGLRLPSALLGILAVALAYGFGRELLGRAGGAVVSVLVAASPAVVRLGQFYARLHGDACGILRQPLASARARPYGPRPLRYRSTR